MMFKKKKRELTKQELEKKWHSWTKQEKDAMLRIIKVLWDENHCCPHFAVVEDCQREERHGACQLCFDNREVVAVDNAMAALWCLGVLHGNCPNKKHFIDTLGRQEESKAIMGDTSIEEIEKMWEITDGTSKTTD
ncbi:hypothetical protein ACFLV6_00645 [Chloroflexota bacterium]